MQSTFDNFRRLRKIGEKRLLPSSCLPVRPHGTTRLALDRRLLNLVFRRFFEKSIQKIQVWLKSDKNKGYFTWRHIRIYDIISLTYPWNEKCFREISCRRENQNTHFMYRLWDNEETNGNARQATGDNIIRRKRFACWIIKTAQTFGICNTYSFFTPTFISRTRLNITW